MPDLATIVSMNREDPDWKAWTALIRWTDSEGVIHCEERLIHQLERVTVQ